MLLILQYLVDFVNTNLMLPEVEFVVFFFNLISTMRKTEVTELINPDTLNLIGHMATQRAVGSETSIKIAPIKEIDAGCFRRPWICKLYDAFFDLNVISMYIKQIYHV